MSAESTETEKPWNTCPRCDGLVDINDMVFDGTEVVCDDCGAVLVCTLFRDAEGRESWQCCEYFYPSEVKVGPHDGQIDHLTLTDLFGKSEAEWVAAAVCHVLAQSGNRWRALHVEEIIPVIRASELVRAGIIDPLIGRARLEDDGFLVTDHAARTITPTQAFVERLSERFS